MEKRKKAVLGVMIVLVAVVLTLVLYDYVKRNQFEKTFGFRPMWSPYWQKDLPLKIYESDFNLVQKTLNDRYKKLQDTNRDMLDASTKDPKGLYDKERHKFIDAREQFVKAQALAQKFGYNIEFLRRKKPPKRRSRIALRRVKAPAERQEWRPAKPPSSRGKSPESEWTRGSVL